MNGRLVYGGLAAVAAVAAAIAAVGSGLLPLPTGSDDRRRYADIVGVSHVHGLYHFSDSQDFLNEGADAVAELGSRVVKLWFTPRYAEDYPNYNGAAPWPAAGSMVELAQTPYYDAVFRKDFHTYILEAYEFPDTYWQDGLSDEERVRVREEFFSFAKHLMTTYRGTGKTFVLQNWEGDNAIGENPDAASVRGMIDWLHARQDGIERARAELSGDSDVAVYGAAEVNWVSKARDGAVTVTNDVLPHTRMDLYSYSIYDAGVPVDPAALAANLDYLRSKAPDSGVFGANNIYIGEFGLPENGLGAELQQLHVRQVVDAAIAWGVRYAVYWQLYCNEARQSYADRPSNYSVMGYWLIRPDGTKSPAYEELRSRMEKRPGQTAK
ncbi:hypothetical protein [Paenibacillus sp.]|uniref:hypothetical protein n=1 Tax=Paenibacillus sp. TaxID=58172 RepID=UPI0028115C1F|nr:hypothetical protein [Paenibacillus sp.]